MQKLFSAVFATQLQRRVPTEAARRVVAFARLRCAWHEEHRALAEYSAPKGVWAHMDLAAEARLKTPRPQNIDAEMDEDVEHVREFTRDQVRSMNLHEDNIS